MIGRRGLLAWLVGTLALVSGCGGNNATPAPSPTPTPAAGDTDWPMYGHDLSRTSYNAGERAISAGNVDQLKPLFRANVGIGDLPSSSGPVVAKGKVYVGSSVPSGPNYFCFDAATGAPVWSADVGHSPPFDGNVGIGSTAAVVDGLVVVGGGDAAYYALSADSGAILWRHPMNVQPVAFAWSSPLVANGTAWVGMSSQYESVRGELRSLSVSDGSIIARQYFVPEGRRGGDIWNSPALSPDGSVVLVASGNDFGGYDGPYTRALVALDPATLAILAARKESVPNQDLDFGTTPVFFHDATGRTLVGANEKNGTFFAYDLAHLADGPIWSRATGVSVGAMPAYDPNAGPGGTLFIVGDNGLLFGVDPATGVDRWPPVLVGFVNGNIALANGLAFAAVGGPLFVVDAATGKVLRALNPETGGRAFSGAVVSGGVLYWMAGPYLNAWGLP
jgi:outer membrane protein assembly factor BamB